MIVKALAENTSINSDLGCEHGLSLYIETSKHTILFDTGASSLFASNAEKVNVQLQKVDTVILSHGHHDHGGGLKTLLKLNDKATIYLSSRAFEKHYANFSEGGIKNVGLDETLMPNHRFTFVGDNLRLDDELELFSAVKCSRLNPTGNIDLLKQAGDAIVPDDFTHEQDLVIRTGGNTVLISGCSHCGIVNILEHFYRENSYYPDVVIGGFHLYNPARDQNEHPDVVREIGAFLLQTKALFYTCHCTGLESFRYLKDLMGDAVGYLSGGQTITI